jgi:hypothetical protein
MGTKDGLNIQEIYDFVKEIPGHNHSNNPI